MKIDGTDEAIMAVLQRDGRLSNREVARRLEISEGQVRQRLRKLFNGGAIRFDAVTDGRAMGINFVAFVKVSVAPKDLEAFLRTCAEFEDVFYLAALSGRFNVMAVLCTRNAIDAMHIVNRRMRPLDGVNEIELRQVSGAIKHDYHEMVVPRT